MAAESDDEGFEIVEQNTVNSTKSSDFYNSIKPMTINKLRDLINTKKQDFTNNEIYGFFKLAEFLQRSYPEHFPFYTGKITELNDAIEIIKKTKSGIFQLSKNSISNKKKQIGLNQIMLNNLQPINYVINKVIKDAVDATILVDEAREQIITEDYKIAKQAFETEQLEKRIAKLSNRTGGAAKKKKSSKKKSSKKKSSKKKSSKKKSSKKKSSKKKSSKKLKTGPRGGKYFVRGGKKVYV